MSEFKFNCPHCDQHLSCDDSYAGQQITCPACQKVLTVPGSQPTPPVITPPPPLLTAAPAPPVSRPQPAPRASAPHRTSGLALASIICSCAGIFINFFGTIPGIICGKLALKQIRRSPGTGGEGMARAGVLTGYIVSALWLIPIGFILVMGVIGGFKAASNAKEMKERYIEYEGAKLDATPDSSGWTLDVQDSAMPNKPLAGRIHGVQFQLNDMMNDVVFDDFGLVFRGSQFGYEMRLSFDGSDPGSRSIDPEKLSQQTLIVRRGDSGDVVTKGGVSLAKPEVNFTWYHPLKKKIITGTPDTYAMRLEFRAITNGYVSGHIYLCVLDDTKSFIRGNFMAKVDRSRFEREAARERELPPGVELPADVKPDADGWTFDLKDAVIPDSPVAGRMFGRPFTAQSVEIGGGSVLMFNQGSGMNSRSFVLHLRESEAQKRRGPVDLNDPARLDRQVFVVTARDTVFDRPTLFMQSSAREDFAAMAASGGQDAYVMRLEFGEFRNGKLAGRIYLCKGDPTKSFIRGKFEARVAKTSAGPAPIPPRPVFPPRPGMPGPRRIQ
ncbi:MAG TPA: DUF4190 domain-containing protein [Candidatus Paceibacterota bacterium]|nr:DUF4190 domain-containing protein [Candidatus Paceibacterota bacterium]